MLLSSLAKGPGQVEYYINSRKLSAQRPSVDAVRVAVTRTVARSFGSAAQAQMQGSSYMATALEDLSDVDFYIYLDGSIEYVTRAHRIAFAKTLQQELATQGLHYPELRLGESRIHGIDGCSGGQPAVDFDVIFARFAGQEPRVPPARYTLPHAVQLACCFLRLMPEAYTNLVRPQSSALIELVHAEAQAAGYAGTNFELLLQRVLKQIANGPPRGLRVALQRKRPHLDVDGDEVRAYAQQWAYAADRVLFTMNASGRW